MSLRTAKMSTTSDRKFTYFLVLSIAMLTISFFFREFDYANVAFEGLTVAVAGILAVWGVYIQGIKEGRRNWEKKQKQNRELSD